MALAAKLNLKPGMKLLVIGKPQDVGLDDVETGAAVESVMVFVKRLSEVDSTCKPAIEAGRADRISWIAYPKAGKLGTDLNRDVLWAHMKKHGVAAIRQVSIDDTWSALRFRPLK